MSRVIINHIKRVRFHWLIFQGWPPTQRVTFISIETI